MARESLLEFFIENYIKKFLSPIARLVGPFAVFATQFMIALHSYFYVTAISQVLLKRYSFSFYCVWTSIGFWLAYNQHVNHLLASMIKPGNPTDFLNKSQVQNTLQSQSSQAIARLGPTAKRLSVFTNKTLINLEDDLKWGKVCRKCDNGVPKPARTHHCSICNECVLMYDHHCPWINNCVGVQNYRYFLCMVFYMSLGFIHMFTSLLLTWTNKRVSHDSKYLFSFIVIMDLSQTFIMFLFNGWNLKLAHSGRTTVEYFQWMWPRKEKNEQQGADSDEDNSSDDQYDVPWRVDPDIDSPEVVRRALGLPPVKRNNVEANLQESQEQTNQQIHKNKYLQLQSQVREQIERVYPEESLELEDIEVNQQNTNYKGYVEIDYGNGNLKDNLYRISGMTSVFQLLFWPDLFKEVPFTGLEWSYWQIFHGFDDEGHKVLGFEDDDYTENAESQEFEKKNK